jgi:hypothetical protein
MVTVSEPLSERLTATLPLALLLPKLYNHFYVVLFQNNVSGHLLSRGFPDAKDGRRRLFSQQTIFPIIVVLIL